VNPDDPLGLITKPTPGDPLGIAGKGPAINKLGLARRIAEAPHPEDFEDAKPASYTQQALGGVAALAASIPGGEALQATMRAFLRRQPYEDALSDIRSAEESANPIVRNYNKLAGGAVAAAAGGVLKGGSAMARGARFGVASGLLKSEGGIKDRVASAAKEGAIDAIGGKLLGEMLPNGVRALASKSLGKTSLARDAAIRAVDDVNYGKAATEGAGATHADVTAALDSPDIKPFADAIRGSSTFKGADDATILRESYKLLSERQGTLSTRIAASNDFKAGSSLEKGEITAAKQKLLDAADKVMPSFRGAVGTHAELAGQRRAFQAAADATSRIVKGSSVAGKKLSANSPEAFKESILKMKPAEAQAALDGVFGRLKNSGVLEINPLKAFGAPKQALGVSKMGPYIDALEKQAGNAGGSLRKVFGIDLAAQLK
jgi:hypothetical protein